MNFNPVLMKWAEKRGGGSAPETEAKTVSLALADGNQIVTPTDGKLLSEVTIEKPANLLPENIAEGVDIAGVIGALVAGGAAKIASGKTPPTGGVLTIEHGLGVLPDIVLLWINNSTAGKLVRAFGCSTAFCDLVVPPFGVRPNFYQLGGAAPTFVYAGIDANTTGPGIHNANDITFTVGSSDKPVLDGFNLAWFAIGGLT